MTVMLFLAGVGLGFWLSERETRRRWNGWRPYRRTDVMSEWRDG